jgi:hypothetical protein
MRIITVGSKQNIAELVQQVFALPTASAERVSQAVQALIDANPHLGGSTIVPAGTPIVIPEVPDLPPKAVEADSGGTFDDLQEQAQQALTYARSVIEDAGKNAAQEAKDSLDVLHSRGFQARARAANLNVESLAERVNHAAKDARAQSKAELANLEALSRALDELVRAISASIGR